jgi:hypothetical protein
VKKILYYLPRVLAIVQIIFISLFALDVFEEKQWFLALLTHLIPSFILIALIIVAWRREKLGGILFLATGFLMLVFTNFQSLIISVPVIIIGALFIFGERCFRIVGN